MARERVVPAGAAEDRYEASAWSVVGGSGAALLALLAVLVVTGLGAPAASAAPCSPTITPGENIARVAADCPRSTTFTIKDGAYKLTGPINANSGDVFRRLYVE